MDFRLDEQQLELRDTVRRFCAARFGRENLARRDGQPIDRSTWREMAQLGVFALLVPEARGGLGLGVVEGAIVFEQLGAHLVGGPVLWTTLAASCVDGAAGGERLVGGIEQADGSSDPIVVEYACEIDALLVLRTDGVFLCAGSELPVFQPVAPLDPLTPVGRADALESSRRYALQREQFGVPIGSFQAVQHMLADMYVRTALARSATYAAAAALDDPEIGDPMAASAAAKLLAGEAAVENARVAIQVHGGMGFTWEMLPHYLLKRAWVLEHTFGNADSHALSLGACIEDAPA